MGKNIKSYTTFPQSIFPPGKGGKPYGKKSKSFRLKNVIRLNRTHSFLNLQQNFSFLFCTLADFQRIKQNSLNLPTYSANYAKFAPIINPFILHYVSGTCPGRELSGIPANYTNSAQFAHIVCELREIHTIC